MQQQYYNNMTDLLMIAEIDRVRRSIEELGMQDEKELESAIRTLEVEIAKSKDAGEPIDEKMELLSKYSALSASYAKARRQRLEKEKEKSQKGMWVIVGISVFAIVLSFVMMAFI